MRCPICESDTRVIESRAKEKAVRRRRECVECLTRFSTYESIILQSLDKHLLEKVKL